MKIRDFSQEDYPGLTAVHNSLNIAWPERPRTPAEWAEADRSRSPRSKYRRWVAIEDDVVVGFASCVQSPWNYPPQSVYIDVEVRPSFQRRGIGSALYDRVMEGIEVFHPPALRADAFAHLPEGFAFLQERGFYEAFRESPVHLEVARFDPCPYEGLEPKLSAQ